MTSMAGNSNRCNGFNFLFSYFCVFMTELVFLFVILSISLGCFVFVILSIFSFFIFTFSIPIPRVLLKLFSNFHISLPSLFFCIARYLSFFFLVFFLSFLYFLPLKLHSLFFFVFLSILNLIPRSFKKRFESPLVSRFLFHVLIHDI